MFGASNTGGGFGSTSFGAAPTTSMFGGTSTFGAQQQKPPAFGGTSSFGGAAGGGGLFGATSQPSAGGLFGGTNTTTSSFGGGGSAFGSSGFKPGGFGQTTQAQQQGGGGLFGSTTTTQQSGGLFGASTGTTTFGATGGTGFGGGGGTSFGGFGAGAAQQQQGTAHVKFNPVQGSDTMMKSGVQTSISTRHQCISCMKEYETKSMEELRCEDYLAGRKGAAGAGGAVGGGGLFGSAQPAAGGGGLFGAQPVATQSGGLFGQQKPLFGTSTAGGFGATATSAAPAFGSTGAFGSTAQPAAGGGLFGAAKPAFGAPATSTTGFGGFGQTATSQAGGMFGQAAAAKPFGAVAPNQTSGGMFGQPAATTGFGQPAAAPATGFGGFGQPQQTQPTIGLFGAQNQAKPAFGGFGATPAASAAPAFGGFGATATTQQSGGLFGATAAKPAFGGFGATAQPSTGFGGFGAAASTGGGGLFGATQQKPAFSFGGATTGAAAPAFGGFGAATSTAATGGGLFGNTAAKPGGLFGTGGTGFGAGTTGFGTATTGFGTGAANTGFGGGGLNFSQQQPAAAMPAAANSAVQQQLLLALASSPFGENPLFKPVLETGKRAEVLKPGSATGTPTGPAAQKVLAASQYKVSPHRNIKVRAKAMDSGSKSSMFEGLDDDLPSPGDMFVPRSSVKKLVLRKKDTTASPSMVKRLEGEELITETSLTVPLEEDSLQVKRAELPPRPDTARDVSLTVDESFAALNPRKKAQADAVSAEIEEEEEEDADKSGQNTSQDSADTDKDEEGGSHPGGVVLRRAGYYTIPTLTEIQPDGDGSCMVEGFTVGREGYGNIHYPGVTNLAGLNLDEIVFFRHKEVIVYPDDNNKPPLGEALNKKAQITLDKVWPTDKQDGSIIKSPERLRAMNYEEKLIRASSRLDARFIEYRPETGSWVFKVDHFSKYGLDESDEEEEIIVNNKKMKTLQLEKRRSTLDAPPDNRTASILQNENQRNLETVESDGGESEERDVVMNDLSSAIMQQKSFIRSALFSGGGDEDDMIDCPPAKPVILQHRNSLLEARPRLIEEIASSILAPTSSKGLGGTSFQLTDTSYNTSLLRSHYSTSMQMNNSSLLQQTRNTQQQQQPTANNNRSKSARLPSYTLTGGYDRFTQLQPGQGPDTVETVTPQYIDEEVPLQRSYLHKRFQQFADSGLFHNKRFRVGFGSGVDHVENPGGGFLNYAQLDQDPLEDWEIASLKQWMQISLDTSDVEIGEDGPVFSPVPNLHTLYTHCVEAKRQYQECEDGSRQEKLWDFRHTWDLLLSLWGRLHESQDGDDMETEMENLETHAETVGRREKLARWLEVGVEERSRQEILAARERKDHLGKVRGLLTGGKVEEACDTLQTAGDHRMALLVAQSGGGGLGGRLVQQQLDRWTEVKADRYINKDRINLYSVVAGQPVHQGTDDIVNTCNKLDWQRSLAHHLWYLTHPISSISDTLAAYDAAWTGDMPYSARPEPSYSEDAAGSLETGGNRPLDIKYQLIKLYADRSHRLERMLAPTTHTPDQLDFRASWLLYRVLNSLGYKVGCPGNSDRLSCDFAGQLEQLGLWEWSVFVLLNVQNQELRRRSVCSVLERNVALVTDEAEESSKEAWLVAELGVPPAWVAAARAVLARTLGNYTQLADQLILAGQWNEAHKVVMQELAPSAILSQNYAQLESFLDRIKHKHIADQISGWESEGKVYLQFIDVDTAITGIKQTRDLNSLGYELERLKPLVTNLCRTISNLPVHNAKQRLSQSEIAKKVAHFMRAVYSFESGTGQNASVTARQLAESLSTLPLPEDYALQELRTLTNSYLAEIMDS